MKRILYIIHDGNIAGGQTVCFNILKAARNSGYQVLVLSQTKGPMLKLMQDNGIKVYVVPLKRSFYFHKIPKLIKILKQEKIDLIHTHNSLSASILIRLTALLSKVPVIAHLHIKNHFSRNIISHIFSRTLDNLTAKTCKYIIAVSQATRSNLIRQGYPEQKIKVIHNAVETDEIILRFNRKALLNKLGINPKAKVFVHIGRLCPNKGQIDLLEALRLITRGRNNIYCLFAGEDTAYGGRFREKLEKIIKCHNLKENIKILGLRQDIDALINISNAVILPSYCEGLPLVALQAMKYRRPFVGYATDGIPEAVRDGKNGYLVKKGDIQGLAKALIAILENPEKAKTMGEAGFKIVRERFNLKQQTERILSLYKKV
jgi:glycosyltransferase involved in cell wall biosynthesis